MIVLWDTNSNLSHARKIRVRLCLNVRGFGVEFYTSPSLAREFPLLASETPCNWDFFLGFFKNSSSQLDACHHLSDDCHHDEDELDEVVEGYHLHPVFGSTRSALSLNLENGWFALCRACLLGWILSFLLQTLRAIAQRFWWFRRSLHVVASDRFYLGCGVPISICFHVFNALLRCTRMHDLLLKVRRSVRRMLRPTQSRAVSLCKLDNFEIVPIWSHISFYFCVMNRNVSCVINSLSPSVPMTRAVSWTLLHHVWWKR